MTASWMATRQDDAERPAADGLDPDTAPAPLLAAGVRRESERVAVMHTELGVAVAAMNYVAQQLSRHELDSERPHLARSLSVLRQALEEVTQ